MINIQFSKINPYSEPSTLGEEFGVGSDFFRVAPILVGK